MSITARLALPLLAAGQAQKELTHNEALQALDCVVAGTVEEPPRNAPPGSPTVAASYIVGSSPSGAWLGKMDCLACWTSGGWRFTTPFDGLAVFVRSTAVWAVYRGGSWEQGQVRGSRLLIGGQQVVGAQAAAIISPSGGTTIDAEARTALAQILGALRGHGLIAT